MFRIKICGVTCLDDAQLAYEAGADAIGLNFFEGSRRYCPPEQAREIAASSQKTLRRQLKPCIPGQSTWPVASKPRPGASRAPRSRPSYRQPARLWHGDVESALPMVGCHGRASRPCGLWHYSDPIAAWPG